MIHSICIVMTGEPFTVEDNTVYYTDNTEQAKHINEIIVGRNYDGAVIFRDFSELQVVQCNKQALLLELVTLTRGQPDVKVPSPSLRRWIGKRFNFTGNPPPEKALRFYEQNVVGDWLKVIPVKDYYKEIYGSTLTVVGDNLPKSLAECWLYRNGKVHLITEQATTDMKQIGDKFVQKFSYIRTEYA